MKKLNTHLEIDNTLSGKVVALDSGYARVVLHTTNAMRADRFGLVHGGFVFSAADFAAMSAVNDENVVLGSANVKFIAPVRVGEVVIFEAKITKIKGKKEIVEVVGKVEEKEVFKGEFTAFVLDKHVLRVAK